MSIKVNIGEDNNETALSYNMDCSRPALAYSGELENSDPTKDSVSYLYKKVSFLNVC